MREEAIKELCQRLGDEIDRSKIPKHDVPTVLGFLIYAIAAQSKIPTTAMATVCVSAAMHFDRMIKEAKKPE